MFQIKHFQIGQYQFLILDGVLETTSSVLEPLKEIVTQISTQKSSEIFAILADQLMLTPEGVALWIEAVDRVLKTANLYYFQSQLSLILDYDERYTHSQSWFADHYDRKFSASPEINEKAQKTLTSSGLDEATAKKILDDFFEVWNV